MAALVGRVMPTEGEAAKIVYGLPMAPEQEAYRLSYKGMLLKDAYGGSVLPPWFQPDARSNRRPYGSYHEGRATRWPLG